MRKPPSLVLSSSPVWAASRRCRNSGCPRAATCSSSGRPAISAKTGLVMNGWSVSDSPMRMPIDRGATWAVTGTPSALAAAMRSRTARWSWGRSGSWATEIVRGRPELWAMWRSTIHSSSTGRKSETTWRRPRPVAATPAAIPASSAAEAVRLGVFSPVEERWLSVGDVLHALHEADEPVPVKGADGGEADAAIAEHDGGHTRVGGREQVRVPRGLAVVVGVDVDPARRHQGPGGVDLLPAPTADRADL